jgi:hypothetical protein
MEDSDIQAQILAQVQKIKDEQKQKLNEEEEKKKQAYIQQQAEIIINSEKYEALSEDEKKQLVIDYSVSYIPKKFHKHPILRELYKIVKSSCFSNVSLFNQKYPFMVNLIDKYEISRKAEDVIDNIINEEDIKKNETHRIENERKAKEAEDAKMKAIQTRIDQLNKSLELFVKNGTSYVLHGHDEQYRYLNYCMSKKDPEFVEKFWNYIDSNNGFSKCPNCGNTPKVMRFGKCTIRQVGNMVTCSDPYRTVCTENLFWIDQYESPPIENISCCDHLYDFIYKKRYILASKYLIETPKKEFHVNTYYFPHQGYKTTSYVEYDPKDPYGEEAKKIQDRLSALSEIEELEARMKVLKNRVL